MKHVCNLHSVVLVTLLRKAHDFTSTSYNHYGFLILSSILTDLNLKSRDLQIVTKPKIRLYHSD